MGLFDFLRPAKAAVEIQDHNVVKKRYKYWRLRIFSGMFLGYIFYYFSRKSLTFAMPALMQNLGFDKADLGFLASVFSITYGISKFVSGIFGDRSNPRYFMGVGLILTGLCNIFFGLSSSILFFALFWSLNGWFQGWGWPPCAKLLLHWYSQNERGTWWGVWNTSHSVGGALIPLLAALCATYFGWRYALYVPGGLCILMGIIVINRLRDTPQSLGLPSIEKFRNDGDSSLRKKETELSLKELLFEYVLRNRYIWVLALSYFFIYIIRTAVNDWSVLYLVEQKGYSLLAAGATISWFEVGGIFGSLASGWISDRLFQGRRGPVNLFFTLGVILSLGAFWMVPQGWFLLDSAILFSLGFTVFGPQMLIGMAAAELSHKKAAGTATGFVGGVAYLGAATAGYPLGKITEVWGWWGFFCILGLCGVIAMTLLAPLWRVKTNPKLGFERDEEEEGPLAEAAASG